MSVPTWIPPTIFVFVGCSLSVLAQECPCDCYFSGDCQGGFCNWGILGDEDSCFWREPKPNGVPGAGCTNDYPDWGRCDGKCTSSLAPNGFTSERVGDLIVGLQLWTAAVAGADGRGLETLGRIPFRNPRTARNLGRIVDELATLSGGPAIHAASRLKRPAVRTCAAGNIDLAMDALVAEIGTAGAGVSIALGFDEQCLDPQTLSRVCGESVRPGQCLYNLIAVFGNALGRAGRMPAEETALPVACFPSTGDVNGDGVVAIQDLLALLSAWGACPNPADTDPLACPADFDEDEVVGVIDLVALLEAWSAS